MRSNKQDQKNESIFSKKFPFADPTYDSTFKKLFGNSNHIDIAKDFINTLFDFNEENKIDQLRIANSENTNAGIEKKSFVDIKYIYTEKNKQGGKIIVEMQRANSTYFLPRVQYYASLAVCQTVDELAQKMEFSNNKYSIVSPYDIPPVYTLVIYTNRKENGGTCLLANNERVENCIAYTTLDDHKIINKNKTYFKIFELNKFRSLILEEEKKELQNFFTKNLCYPNNLKEEEKEKILNDNFYKKLFWLDFLTFCHEKKKIDNSILENDGLLYIKKSYEVMQKEKWSRQEREGYDKILKDSILDNIIKEKQKQKNIDLGQQRGQAEKEIQAFQNQYNKNNEISYKDFKNSYKNFLGESPQFFKSRHVERIKEENSGWDSSNWPTWQPKDIFDELNTNSQPFFSQSQRIEEEKNNHRKSEKIAFEETED